MFRSIGAAILTTVPFLPAVLAAVPTQINHQGVVSVNGVRFTGTGHFKFAVVDAETGGSNLWTHDGSQIGSSGEPAAALSVPVTDGIYSVALGGAGMSPLTSAVFASDQRWLRVWFSHTGQPGSFEALVPVHRLTSVPYALWAGVVDTVADGAVTTAKIADGAVTAAKLAAGVGSPWLTSGANIYYPTGRVGIGTATPTVALDVAGEIMGDNLPLIPSSRMGFRGGIWHQFYTSSFNNWQVGLNGASIQHTEEGINITVGGSPGNHGGVYTGIWAPVSDTEASRRLPGRFLVRWRTSTLNPGFKSLLRCGVGTTTDPDGATDRGVGFMQFNNKIYAYLHNNTSPLLTEIGTVTAEYERSLGEVTIGPDHMIRYYLNGELKHTAPVPHPFEDDFPLGRISLCARNSGGNGTLNVNWVGKYGWGRTK